MRSLFAGFTHGRVAAVMGSPDLGEFRDAGRGTTESQCGARLRGRVSMEGDVL